MVADDGGAERVHAAEAEREQQDGEVEAEEEQVLRRELERPPEDPQRARDADILGHLDHDNEEKEAEALPLRPAQSGEPRSVD